MSIRNDILANLETALEGITVDAGYPITVNSVTRFWQNTNTLNGYREPLVMLLDGSPEEKVAQDASQYRYAFDLKLMGYVKTSTSETTHDELNKLQAALKQLIDSQPSLGAHCLALLFLGTDGNAFDEDQNQAWVTVNCRIIYWCDAGSF